jgi:hypothetical protein
MSTGAADVFFFFHVMAELVPATDDFIGARVKGGWVYIMTDRRNGTLYTGVTAYLPPPPSSIARPLPRLHQTTWSQTTRL